MNLKIILRLIVLTLVLTIPVSAFAATTTNGGSATIDTSALASSSTKPTIFGTASDTKTLRIGIYRASSTEVVYRSKVIKVSKDGVWKTKVSKKIPNGTYTVVAYGPKGVSKNTLSTQVLIVDTDKKSVSKSNTTFVVEALPLLVGGTAKSGASVPIAYLQVTNIGNDAGVLKGFWVKQNGSASENSIIGLSTVDETGTIRATVGGIEGSTPFKNKTAFASVPDVSIAPGQIKLFTIKANMSNKIDSYLGTQSIIDVTSADIGAVVKARFPIKGTVWTIGK